QDFTTASWTVFSPAARLITINAARFDAVKHGALAVVGDAAECLKRLDRALEPRERTAWAARAQQERTRWDTTVNALRTPVDELPTYAQIVGTVNALSAPDDY